MLHFFYNPYVEGLNTSTSKPALSNSIPHLQLQFRLRNFN